MSIGSTVLEFTGEQVINASIVEEVSPLCTELPASALDFKIMLYDESFSMFSGEYYQQLKKRLPILVYERVGLEDRFVGKFYLDEWKNTSEREFEFSAIDLVGLLEMINYDGGFWATPTEIGAVLEQLLTPINVAYSLSPALSGVKVSGWIPPGNYRGAIQQVCFAAGATVSTARSQVLEIKPITIPQLVYDTRVTDQDKLMERSVKLEQQITSIEIVSHNYSQSETVETIFDEDLQAGSHKIIFEKPYYSILVNGPGYVANTLATEAGDELITEGGDSLEVGGQYNFGTNSLYLELSSPGHVTITGRSWVDSKRSFLFREEGIADDSNPIKVEDATMVSVGNAQGVLDKMRDYYRQRYTQEMTMLPTNVKPGNIVKTSAFYGESLIASVLKMELDLTGGYLAKTSIRGWRPQYVPPSEQPVRRARVGVAICGADLTRQNMFREYE